MEVLSPDNISNLLTSFFIALIGLGVGSVLLYAFGYVFFLWYKHRTREYESLNSTLLQVSVPRDNEIKIDAAEQMFSALASLHKGGRLAFLKPQPHISFEIF